jgi:hypothetical protein
MERKVDYDYDENTGLKMVLCESRATLPDFVVTLGGKKFTMTPFDYIVDVSKIPMLFPHFQLFTAYL